MTKKACDRIQGYFIFEVHAIWSETCSYFWDWRIEENVGKSITEFLNS